MSDEAEREKYMRVDVAPGIYEPRITDVTGAAGLGSVVMINLQMLHRVLLRSARRLAEAHETQAAVILAQTASEVQVERAVAALSRRDLGEGADEVLSAYLRPYAMHPQNKRLRELWEHLSGDTALTQQPFWALLGEHYRRRNSVAHRGGDASYEEANESIGVVLELMEHMEAVMARLFPPPA